MTRDRPSSAEIPVQFIEIEPLYKHIFRKPLRRFHTWKRSILERHAYGPPYAPPNPLLDAAFLDEVRCKNANLLSVHECLSVHRINPNDLSHPDDNHNRPLHYAAKYGRVRLVKMLLRAKADAKKLNGLGQSPLMMACGGKTARHAEIVRILTTTTTEVDDEGRDTTAMIEDIDMVDRGGNTALTNAIRAENVRSVAVLLAAGAAVTVAAEGKRYDDDDDDDDASTTRTRTMTTTKGRSIVASPGTVAALPLALNIRAQTAGIDVVGSDEYFDTLKEYHPSWRDRIMKRNACAPSSVIVDMLHDVIEGRAGQQQQGVSSFEGGGEGGGDLRDEQGCCSCCCRMLLSRKRL